MQTPSGDSSGPPSPIARFNRETNTPSISLLDTRSSPSSSSHKNGNQDRESGSEKRPNSTRKVNKDKRMIHFSMQITLSHQQEKLKKEIGIKE